MSPDAPLDVYNEFCQQRTRLWSYGLWALRGGRPELITLSELRKKIHVYEVPEKVVVDCLRTFSMQGLILCRNKDDTVINNPYRESDFERFGITPKGSDLGPNYRCNE